MMPSQGVTIGSNVEVLESTAGKATGARGDHGAAWQDVLPELTMGREFSSGNLAFRTRTGAERRTIGPRDSLDNDRPRLETGRRPAFAGNCAQTRAQSLQPLERPVAHLQFPGLSLPSGARQAA
jgi:hypothetical protein